MYSIEKIYRYPIKSFGPESLFRAEVRETGIINDRRWMLIDSQNRFITLRQCAQLWNISVQTISDTQWQLTFPNAVSFILDANFVEFESIQSDVWGTKVDLLLSKNEELTHYLSDFTSSAVRIGLHLNEGRLSEEGYPLYLADSQAILICNSASLSALPPEIKMLRFRPNIVVNGAIPFEEDSWERVSIGSVILENVKLCGRCGVINIPPDSVEERDNLLKDLSKFRKFENKIAFGVLMRVVQTGTLSLEDRIQILK